MPPELTDTTRVGIWNDSIPGVKELPAPYKNIIPPVDSVKVKPDPVDSLTNIIADQIIVLFNSKDIKTDMSSFARMFKKVYPDASYSVIYYNPTAGTMLLQVPEQRLHDLLYEIPRRITGIDYKLTTNPMLYVEKSRLILNLEKQNMIATSKQFRLLMHGILQVEAKML